MAIKSRFLNQKNQSEIADLQQKNQDLINQNFDLQKENIILQQANKHLEARATEFNNEKETILLQLSEKLILKNQEQQDKITKNQEENIKKITADLFKNFESVTSKVISLNDQVKESSKDINLTKRALLSPGSAGRTAEITLENILKSSGLKEKENLESPGDFILQSHFSDFSSNQNEGSRPDALLFFPGDQVAIIDSKSSSHFIELEEAIHNHDNSKEKELLTKIKESFRRHIDSLKKKEYSKSLFESLLNKDAKDYKILIIMFLQTEKMLEIIRRVDPSFEQKALESGVIVSSPIGLINFLSQARIVIDRTKQQKNIEDLKISVARLMDNISIVFKESKDLGKSLNKALNLHNKMAKTMNKSVYSAVKNISDLGIEGKKSGNITLLEEYDTEQESN
ncbi:MAG: DNA recombination protein RmuC [Rickettsiales bacterium]|nr:DNA recombination protein RmuC [Rickettsiales bacterium]